MKWSNSRLACSEAPESVRYDPAGGRMGRQVGVGVFRRRRAVVERTSVEIPVRNPRTGQTDFSFKAASGQEVAEKATRLRRNQVQWAARGIEERIAIMRRWSAELIAHAKAIGAADGA